MNISIVASGSRGDVQPYIALGTGLKARGHHVQILTSGDFEKLVREAGLVFCSMGVSTEQILQSDEWRSLTENGNFLNIVRGMNREMKKHAHTLADILPDMLTGTDLIVAGAGGMGGVFTIAKHLNIPFVQAFVFPTTPTSEFASPLTPKLPFGKSLNRLSFRVMRQMLWQSTRIADVTVRKKLGLSSAPFFGHFRQLDKERIPILYGYSRHVLPIPQDWDDFVHVTGYWFLDAPSIWTPPDDLVQFLADGDAPVYIGFGSMGDSKPEKTTQTIIEAVQRAGKRAIILTGWAGLGLDDIPENVHILKYAPHSWLFPKMVALIHHGGAGTTASGFRAGIPMTIVPRNADQPYWGKRVKELGVGLAPIPRKKLTAENLSDAINTLTENREFHKNAQALAQKIQQEDGLSEAVKWMQHYLAQ